MYENAGKSIKGLTSMIVGIAMIISVIAGILIIGMAFAEGELGNVLLGIVVTGLGCFLAWVGGMILYAYGEIADGIQRLAEHTLSVENESHEDDEVPKGVKQVVYED